ncbi:MAG: transposase [Bacteroidota bacterium]|nr:transposase [Bacteroidota bacterium]
MDDKDSAQSNGEGKICPTTEVIPKAKRHRFSASYKLRILEEADAALASGELGALLRREGLYPSHLAQWHRQREQGRLFGATQLSKKLLAQDEEIRRLSRARSELKKAKVIIEVQENSRGILGKAARSNAHRAKIQELRATIDVTLACAPADFSRTTRYRSLQPSRQRLRNMRLLSMAQMPVKLISDQFTDQPPR